MSLKKKQKNRYLLGHQDFAAINAVEGLRLNPESEARLSALRSQDLTAQERRDSVVQAYKAKPPNPNV